MQAAITARTATAGTATAGTATAGTATARTATAGTATARTATAGAAGSLFDICAGHSVLDIIRARPRSGLGTFDFKASVFKAYDFKLPPLEQRSEQPVLFHFLA